MISRPNLLVNAATQTAAAIGLAALATIVALVTLRLHKAIWLSCAALTVLLTIEAYIGGLTRDDSKDTVTAMHVPPAIDIMGLVTWISMRTGRISTRP